MAGERTFDTDVVVVGSGFGGSVSALRLTEKGYRVTVLEAGKRFTAADSPTTNWNLRRFLYLPQLGMRGIQRLNLLSDVLVLSGAGVGDGSLVYANTLYEPLGQFYRDRQWADITDWRAELAPHYDQAKRMLGVTPAPDDSPNDAAIREIGERMGVGHTYRPTHVGVYFGAPGETVPDPYFGGAGPDRVRQVRRLHGRLPPQREEHPRSQLPVPRRGRRGDGARRTEGDRHRPAGRWRLRGRLRATRGPMRAGGRADHDRAGDPLRRRPWHDPSARRPQGAWPLAPPLRPARGVGADQLRVDPRRVDAEGHRHRFLAGHRNQLVDLPQRAHPRRGGALLEGLQLDGFAHDAARARRRSDAATDQVRRPGAAPPDPLPQVPVGAPVVGALGDPAGDAERRQQHQPALETEAHGGAAPFRTGTGEPNPSFIPEAEEAARHTADIMGGDAYGSVNEALLDVPITAHILGGCVIGPDHERGVIDTYQRVYGHAGPHVADGSAISANLGVNPSLTITAQTERAMAFWPNRGDADPRPLLGERYQRVDAVAPGAPAVPVTAPAALRRLAPAPVD